MRATIIIAFLIMSMNLADASQQALLRLQWQQIEAQKNHLADADKMARVQALSSLFQAIPNHRTNLSQPIADIFEQGAANDAEVAYVKWLMLTRLGFPQSEFRLVYLNSEQQNSVALVHYGVEETHVFTRGDLLAAHQFTQRIEQDWSVVSVIDPNKIKYSRTGTRAFNTSSDDNNFL